jgi:hypothetical protein
LELIQVDVQRAVEAERGGDGRNNLSNKPVQVGQTWGGDAKVLFANIIDSLVVNLPRVFKKECKSSSEILTMKEQSECSRVVWVVRTEL